MIKIVITGLWICGLSLASVYYSLEMAKNDTSKNEPAEFFGGLDYVRGDVMSIPVISNGKVHGYFLTRLVYTAEPEKLAKLSVPAKILITDELYTTLVGNRVIDFPNMNDFDLDAFRNGIREALNKKVGEDIFQDILVEQIDFLTKADVRSNISRKNYTMKSGDPIADKNGETAQEAPAVGH